MGNMGEFSLPTRLFLKSYRWRRIEPVPWTPLSKPLAQCRVALVSSAGFVSPGQPPFDETVHGGDTSFREVPDDTDTGELIESHRSDSFDHSGIGHDPNLAFPIDRLRELVQDGRIREANGRHFSFMGSITAPGRLIRDTGPEIARRLAVDGVDVALLVPV